MNFNINNWVKVKLNDKGYQILVDKEKELEALVPSWKAESVEHFKAKADKDGYSKYQMWDFMRTFGDKIPMGCPLPFDVNIIIDCDNKEEYNGVYK
tara:strand:+ start:550 stop:837 length:288 start_codon:yes stop_codon:yes gene_type:complete